MRITSTVVVAATFSGISDNMRSTILFDEYLAIRYGVKLKNPSKKAHQTPKSETNTLMEVNRPRYMDGLIPNRTMNYHRFYSQYNLNAQRHNRDVWNSIRKREGKPLSTFPFNLG